MKITDFLKKFADTYKETYEAEEKMLMKKQREHIDSLKISVGMSEELDENELLELAHRYVIFMEEPAQHFQTWNVINSPSNISIQNISVLGTPVYANNTSVNHFKALATSVSEEDIPIQLVTTWGSSIPRENEHHCKTLSGSIPARFFSTEKVSKDFSFKPKKVF